MPARATLLAATRTPLRQSLADAIAAAQEGQAKIKSLEHAIENAEDLIRQRSLALEDAKVGILT